MLLIVLDLELEELEDVGLDELEDEELEQADEAGEDDEEGSKPEEDEAARSDRRTLRTMRGAASTKSWKFAGASAKVRGKRSLVLDKAAVPVVSTKLRNSVTDLPVHSLIL